MIGERTRNRHRSTMRFAYFLIFIAIMPLATMADEFYAVEPDREAKGIPYPDHLTPISSHAPSWWRKYRRRIEDHLFQTEADIAQYLVMPSFGPQSCVSVRSEIPKDVEVKFEKYGLVPRDKKKYFIIVTRSSESLWYSMAENNDEHKTRLVGTSRVDREISIELAGAIQWAWGRMLHHTRYPSTDLRSGNKDGCTYEFSAWVEGLGAVSGETWSPRGGLTAELVNLGNAIAAFATEKEATEEPLLKKLRDFESKIPEVPPSPVFVPPLPKDGPVDPFAPD